MENTQEIVRGYECLSACLVNCINACGIRISASDIFWAATDEPFCIDKHGLLSIRSIALFMEKYDINFSEEKYQGNQLKEFVRAMKQKEGFFLLDVEPKFLGYSKEFVHNRGDGHYLYMLDVVEEGILFADAYVSNVKKDAFVGIMKWDDLIKAWGANGYSYCFIMKVDVDKFQGIKEEAKKNLCSYIRKMKNDVAENQVLLQFKKIFDEIERTKKIDFEVVENLFFQIKVEGFLVAQNCIWEKIYERGRGEEDTYYSFIERWNYILLWLRKSFYSQKIEKLCKHYDYMEVLAKEEILFLEQIFLSADNEK